MKERDIRKGYKVFESDWMCMDFQYEVGKTYGMDDSPICCQRGFHYCTKLADCFKYYGFSPKNKVAEIEALGEISTNEGDSKCCTNKIHIVKEISWQEVLEMVNIGNACTGNCNSGNRNSGNRNSGDWNSGNRNSGNCNSGDWNSGDRNSGDWNSGDRNSGDWNSGNCNSGNCNSGNRNSGNRNSGDWNSGNRNSGNCNSGDWNSGDRNSGDWNSGDRNSGDWNSGNCNSGNCNSGNRNSGNRNSGDWNKTNFSNGCFNTELPKIYLFDKPSDWTYQDWINSSARYVLNCMPCNTPYWVSSCNMRDEEKEAHPEHETTGGFLNNIKVELRQVWWNNLSNVQKHEVLNIPNFDKEIFEEITGIDVDEVE